MQAVKLSPRQRGDFQTPKDLTNLIWNTIDVSKYDLIIEPTFGEGTFLSTLPNTEAYILGWEIHADYYHQSVKSLQSNPNYNRMNLHLADVFSVLENDIPLSKDSRILTVGNPPWVTNSEQSTLGGKNTGSKRNLKSLNGLAAKTGKANFDISEAIVKRQLDL